MNEFSMESEENNNDFVKTLGFIIAGITAVFLLISELLAISRSVHNSITELCVGMFTPRRSNRPRPPDVESDTTVVVQE